MRYLRLPLEVLAYHSLRITGLIRGSSVSDERINDEAQFFEDKIFQITGERDWIHELRREQMADESIAFAVSQLEKEGGVNKGRFKQYTGMHVSNGILLRGRKTIVPATLRETVCRIVHSQGHPGYPRTVDLLKRK